MLQKYRMAWLRSRPIFFLILFASIVLSQFSAAPARAATWTICQVGSCDFSSIQAAINGSSSGDTLQFAPKNSANEIYLETVTLNKSLNFIGQNTTIDAQNGGTAVTISGNPTVVMENINIQNGSSSGNGAGIRLNGGNLTLIDVTLNANSASGTGLGGALFVAGGSSIVQLTDVTIINNTAVSGAGIYNNGDLAADNLTLTDNNAANGSGIYNNGEASLTGQTVIQRNGDETSQKGGGIFNAASATFTISESDLSNNDANNGAGIYNEGTLEVTDANLGSGNVAVQAGGGLYNSGQATLTNSGVAQNEGETGSGIYNEGTLTVTNSTLSRNDGSNGAGLYNMSGSANLNNATIHLSIGVSLYANGGTVTVGNSIISSVSGHAACAGTGTAVSNGYNLASDQTCTFLTASGDLTGLDPLLNGITSPGNGAVYHSPKLNSPVVNSGNPAAPGSGGSACLASDQRGVARPQSEQCDIGAVEIVISRLYVPVVIK